MDEDVAKGRRNENRRKRGEGDHPEFADALANIPVLRREAYSGRNWKNGWREPKHERKINEKYTNNGGKEAKNEKVNENERNLNETGRKLNEK